MIMIVTLTCIWPYIVFFRTCITCVKICMHVMHMCVGGVLVMFTVVDHQSTRLCNELPSTFVGVSLTTMGGLTIDLHEMMNTVSQFNERLICTLFKFL